MIKLVLASACNDCTANHSVHFKSSFMICDTVNGWYYVFADEFLIFLLYNVYILFLDCL